MEFYLRSANGASGYGYNILQIKLADLVTTHWAAMKDAPVRSVSAECLQDTVPDVLEDHEIDVERISYCSSEAMSIWDLRHRLN